MESQTKGTLQLIPREFEDFIIIRHAQYKELGSYPTMVCLCSELEDVLTSMFFNGHLRKVVTFNTDSKGKIRMFLDGIKTMFTSKLDPYHTFWVLDSKPPVPPDGAVTPTTGPGNFPTGGTPAAMRMAKAA